MCDESLAARSVAGHAVEPVAWRRYAETWSSMRMLELVSIRYYAWRTAVGSCCYLFFGVTPQLARKYALINSS